MMKRMDKKDYNDANWVKVDLHLHSPKVDSFSLLSGIDLNSSTCLDKMENREINDLIYDKTFDLYPCNHVPEHCEEANFDK